MAKRIRLRLSALVGGIPLANEIVEFTPPEVNAKTDSNEGQFVASEDIVGYEALTWTLKVQAERYMIMPVLGKFLAGDAMVNVTERGKNQDGVNYVVNYTMGGVIKSIKQDTVKMGEKPVCTIEGTAKAFKEIDNGMLNYDIDTRTGKTIIGGFDQTDM